MAFDDIVRDTGEIKRNFKIVIDIEICPVCRSTKVDAIDGIFVRGGMFTQIMQCVVCKEKWSVTYDADLNIIEIKIGA